jgi:hypothetical protein
MQEMPRAVQSALGAIIHELDRLEILCDDALRSNDHLILDECDRNVVATARSPQFDPQSREWEQSHE